MAKPLRIFPRSGDIMLEFDKIRDVTVKFVKGETAGDFIKNELNGYAGSEIEYRLILQEDIIQAIQLKNIGLDYYTPIQNALHKAAIPEYVLDLEDILQVRNIVNQSHALYSFSKDSSIKHLHTLVGYLHKMDPQPKLFKTFLNTFDAEGNVLDGASQELAKVRKNIQQIQKEVYSVFRRELEKYKQLKYLAEGDESVRNGRLVLRVMAEHKRKVAGMIVDDSDSGKTIFIEPENTLLLYNHLVEYEIAERKELQKIFKELTREISSFANQLLDNYLQIEFLDVMIAKARLGILLQAKRPVITEQKEIYWKGAKHPLLVLEYQTNGKAVVPFDIELNEQQKIILISGPNAGGKSIVLKTIGLFQLMLSNAYLLPLSEGSRSFLFEKLCIDIGDQQSYADGLSTYSAKLKNLKLFIDYADNVSLILLDEFGSGTEPVMGGAIAESVLKELYEKGAFCIINTHYSNLKSVAHHTKGMVNAAMVYNEKDLKPTYQLKIGRPGSSYALEIAKTLRFSNKIINYAKKKAGKSVVELEEVISRIDSEKTQLEKQVNEYKSKIEHLNKLIKAYEHMHKQFELKRVKLKLETKKKEWESEAQQAKTMEKLVQELRKQKNLEKALEMSETHKLKNKEASDSFRETQQRLSEIENNKISFEPRPGDPVKLVINGMIGFVQNIENQYYSIATDHFTFKVLKKDILPATDPLEINKAKHVESILQEKEASFQSIIDIRGMVALDAAKTLEAYLDQAILQNVPSIKVLHGKGSGALRKVVSQTIKGIPYIQSVSHPVAEEGGDGVTIISFE